jgi:alkylated DNA repair dioxygenase AlkB
MKQQELFAPALPHGLIYQPDFLTPDDEQALIAEIQCLPFSHSRYKEYTARRRTVNFGYIYDFSANRAQPAPQPPAFLEALKRRVAHWAEIPASTFVQVLVSEYQPGVPLGWHRDVPDFEVVVGVSLASAARLRFRPYPWRIDYKNRVFALDVEPRSIYILRDEARWGWQHSVPPVKQLRYSITLRTARERSSSGTRS